MQFVKHTIQSLRKVCLPMTEATFKEAIKKGDIEDFQIVANWQNNDKANIAVGKLNLWIYTKCKGEEPTRTDVTMTVY